LPEVKQVSRFVIDDIMDTAERAVTIGVPFVRNQVIAWLKLPSILLCGEKPNAQQERLRADVQSIFRLVRLAQSSGIQARLLKALDQLAQNKDKVERAFVVWADLIEVLVQTQEKRFGSYSGAGVFKAAEVKAALRYLLRKHKFRLPSVPEALQPVVVDLAASWLIDAIVLSCNSYGLWLPGTTPMSWKDRLWVWLRRTFMRVTKPIVNAASWIGAKIYFLFEGNLVLAPNVRAAVDAVARDGLIVNTGDVFADVVSALEWVGNNRDEAVKSFKIVLEAVQEAESFVELGGQQKKVYARDLVMAVLEELGFTADSGLIHSFVQAAVDAFIEVAVHLFHKHGVFEL
jgi:hypothetical protein